jgi:hypothetical protein
MSESRPWDQELIVAEEDRGRADGDRGQADGDCRIFGFLILPNLKWIESVQIYLQIVN